MDDGVMDISARTEAQRIVWLSGLEQLMQSQTDGQPEEINGSSASPKPDNDSLTLEFSYQVLADQVAAATRMKNASR